MAATVTLRSLLHEAERFLSRAEARLPRVEGPPWRWFMLGGEWMRETLAELRSAPRAPFEANFTALGLIKYALAGLPALFVFVLAGWTRSVPLLIAGLLVFYAIESQLVFLFPVAIDGSATPFRDSRILAGKAGGAWGVMPVVMGLAAVMVFGGFFNGRFLRCWALGCLGVLLWYEKLRV